MSRYNYYTLFFFFSADEQTEALRETWSNLAKIAMQKGRAWVGTRLPGSAAYTQCLGLGCGGGASGEASYLSSGSQPSPCPLPGPYPWDPWERTTTTSSSISCSLWTLLQLKNHPGNSSLIHMSHYNISILEEKNHMTYEKPKFE